MRKKLRGVKRKDFLFDYDLYRVQVPIQGVTGSYLSVLDLYPEGAQETVLFLHGYAGVLESWEFQINYFASNNFRVIAPDLRGHGQSDAPYTQYTMPELISDLEQVAHSLQLEPYTLVAHSFGGSIAIEYAHAYPERLKKLVLIATAGEYPLPRFVNFLLRLPLKLLRPLWRFRPRWDAELHVVQRMMKNNMRSWQGWSLMRDLTTPTLIITGERDNYFPRRVFEDVGNMIPNAEIVDVGAAKHKVQLERQAAVNRVLRRFIEGQESRSSWREIQINQASGTVERDWLNFYSEGTPPSIPIPKRPLTTILDSAADWAPRRTALIFYGNKIKYKELAKRVNQFAHVLHGMGVRPGDRVMLLLPNMPQFVTAFFGILKVGGVVVLSNADADREAILYQVRETQPKVFITLHSFAPLAQHVKDSLGLENFIFADFRSNVSPLAYMRLVELWGLTEDEEEAKAQAKALGERMSTLRRDAPLEPLELETPIASSSLAVISYTSGTTAKPKGVCLSHANLVTNTLQTRHWIPELSHGKETFLSVIPLLHSYGLLTGLCVPIALASTIVLLPIFDTQEVLEEIRDHRVSVFPGMPSMYTAINQMPNVREYGLSSVNACISGAAPLPIEVQEAFEKLTQGRLVEGFGLTEASPVTHANPLIGRRKSGSIGIPLPNTDAKIVDMVTGEDLPNGHIGALLVSGPQVMMGYWNADGSIDRSAIKDGWLDTEDVAVRDNDGYFKIISRKKDAILFGDYSVYPRDVEEVLYENNKVLEVAVVGVGMLNGDKKIKAFVVPRPGTELTKEELLELCRKRLEPYEVPWDIEFRESLPKSFIGKVLRRMLTQEVLAEESQR